MVKKRQKLNKRKSRIRESKKDRIFNIVNYILVGFGGLVVIYPLLFILAASVSDPNAVYNGKVWLLPIDFTLEGYNIIFQDPTIWHGYLNSIIYTVSGTTLNVVITLMTAFALSQRSFKARHIITIFFVITMFFSGGIIPSYILVRNLGMINTIWAMILPSALSMWNIIIARTFFQSTIPDELYEAAFVEGASYTKCFLQIILPLSSALIAILILFYAVAQWNSYFNALLYLTDSKKYPLQLVLRTILVLSQTLAGMFDPDNAEFAAKMQRGADLIKYGTIIVASAPLLILYPFLQKYFVKGVMVGSLKG